MTDWAKLAEPFPPEKVKLRPGAAKWDHKPNCQGPKCRETRDPEKHVQFNYVDARDVAQRLDEVVGPEGWDFTCDVIPGYDVVKGRLTIGDNVREDHGYPNSERDEEPIKAATSDALKRCAVLFGIGRHLYDDNHATPARRQPVQNAPQRHVAAAPRRSSTAVPEPQWDGLPVAHPNGTGHGTGPMTTRELLNLAEGRGMDIKRVGDEARRMYGKWKLVELTDEQRQSIAEELELVPVTT